MTKGRPSRSNGRRWHEAGDHRFAFDLRVLRQLLRDRKRIGHVLRGENDKHAVGILIGGHDLQRFAVTIRTGVAENVDMIIPAPVRREKIVELLHRHIRKRRELAAGIDQRIGRKHTRSAGVSDDA